MAAKDKFLNIVVHLNISLFTAIMTNTSIRKILVLGIQLGPSYLADETEYGDNCKILQWES